MNRATTVLIENACLEKRNFFFHAQHGIIFGPLVCYITFNSQSEAVIFFFFKKDFSNMTNYL